MTRHPTAADVIAGKARWSAECGDAVAFVGGLPDDSVDLLFTSPPYELARTYGIGKRMVGGQAWVDWMVELVRAAAPKVKGLIAVNCEGQTRNYRYSCAPFLLVADLHRAGFNLRKPVVFHRVGVPGSGGPDWLRNDWEPVVCVTRRGRLPWSCNTACGWPPKWAPGGEMSNRLSDGTRVNQWGKTVGTGANVGTSSKARKADGSRDQRKRPSHVVVTKAHTKRDAGRMREQTYTPPAVANPGNVLRCDVGGGRMGHALAHENEAPFPLALAEFFVKSFCPPDGVCCDPFGGSGTTAHAAVTHGRRAVLCDLRESQVELTRRRMGTVTPTLFPGV